jgi:glycosyltransferase involved in cell wall biosynthesis
VTELLVAFDALRQAHRDVVLLVVGDQERERDPLPTETVARLAAGAGVICLGWHDDIRPALAAADVCVLPSHREGLPNTLLEAGASGLPVVASDINGCNEVVEHGRTGILVPVGNAEALHDALLALLDLETRRAMGSAARQRVADRFDHAEYCRALEEYYIEALNSSRQRAGRMVEPSQYRHV